MITGTDGSLDFAAQAALIREANASRDVTVFPSK
jgi:hypothetical protein